MNDDHDRLTKLSAQISEIRQQEHAAAAKDNQKQAAANNMSTGARAGAELITFTIAGGVVGWLLDGQFDTKPLFLIIFLLAGVCTGFYEVYRITNNMGSAVGYAGAKKPDKKS